MASGGRVLLVAMEHDGFGPKKGPPYEAGSGWRVNPAASRHLQVSEADVPGTQVTE